MMNNLQPPNLNKANGNIANPICHLNVDPSRNKLPLSSTIYLKYKLLNWSANHMIIAITQKHQGKENKKQHDSKSAVNGDAMSFIACWCIHIESSFSINKFNLLSHYKTDRRRLEEYYRVSNKSPRVHKLLLYV